MKKIVVIGDGGHARVVEEVVNSNPNMKVIAKLDDKYKNVLVESDIIRAPISYITQLINDQEIGVVIGIGNNELRNRIVSELPLHTDSYVSAIHCNAIVSPSAKIGRGTVVMPGSVVNANAIIGDHVIINTGAIVEHDCEVGDYAHISPRSTITGQVSIGEGTQVGASATVIPGKSVGNWSKIGAGAVVVHNFGDRTTLVGIPAREIRREGR